MLRCPLNIPTSVATLCAVFFFSIHNPRWMWELQEMNVLFSLLMFCQGLSLSRCLVLICWKKGWAEFIFNLETNSHIAAQASLKLMAEPRPAIPLPQPSKCWNCRCEPSCLIVSVVSFGDRVSWCYLGCPGTTTPPASAHWALSLQVCTTTPGWGSSSKTIGSGFQDLLPASPAGWDCEWGTFLSSWSACLLILKETPDSLPIL